MTGFQIEDFEIGDRVRIVNPDFLPGRVGTVTLIRPYLTDSIAIKIDGDKDDWNFPPAELERIDELEVGGTTESSAVPTGVAGSSADDGRGAGTSTQHPEQGAALVETRPDPVTGFVHTTTRRMRINITRNTKGYNYETTFELTSDDPDLDLSYEMELGLRMADRAARDEIARREYVDNEGQPGSDEKPF